MSGPADKRQLAISPGARDRLEEVVEKGGFADLQDVYRLAIAVALVDNLEPASADGRVTIFGAASVDPEGSIRTAIMQLREDGRERPYALGERLAEAGIDELHRHLDSGRPMREFLSRLTECRRT